MIWLWFLSKLERIQSNATCRKDAERRTRKCCWSSTDQTNSFRADDSVARGSHKNMTWSTTVAAMDPPQKNRRCCRRANELRASSQRLGKTDHQQVRTVLLNLVKELVAAIDIVSQLPSAAYHCLGERRQQARTTPRYGAVEIPYRFSSKM